MDLRGDVDGELKRRLKREVIMKTCLCNVDSLKLHFYIVKVGFTGVYIIFSYFCSKHRLWVLFRTASVIYVFEQK